MSSALLERLLIASSMGALAACGGGGGSGPQSTPPAPGTRVCPDGTVVPATQACPLPPPPPPPASPAIFPDVTTDKSFAVLGLEADSINTSASALRRDGFSVRYDVASQGYLMDLPSTEEFRLVSSLETESYWRGSVQTGFYGSTLYDIFKPRSTNPEIQLAYTSFAATSGYYSLGLVAFGSATPDSGVPVTGTATYNALIAGRPLDVVGAIRGNATFQFDFGAGTLSGKMDPVLELNSILTNLGSYDFVNTVFGVGSATFSGRLSTSGTTTLGAFDGRFTGPAAEELMARWTAPYRNPTSQQWNEMFGVIVGRRQ